MHLRIGWLHLMILPRDEVVRELRDGIQKLNEAHGVPNSFDEGYHETLTRLWVYLIDAALAAEKDAVRSSKEFVAKNAARLRFERTFEHYSMEAIRAPQARRRWVEPDREPLPELPNTSRQRP